MKKAFYMLFILSFLILLVGCYQNTTQPSKTSDDHTVKQPDKDLVKSSKQYVGDYFDTSLSFLIWDEEEVSDEFWSKLETELQSIDQTFSRTNANSELYKLNEASGEGAIEVSAELFSIIKRAVEYAELTNGKFEPTIGPLIELWGPYEDPHIPTSEELKNIDSIIDYELLVLDEEHSTVELTRKGMILDLGAIAKGYAADRIKTLLKENGYEHAIINLGGNILTVGERYATNKKGSQDWIIGLTNPNYDSPWNTPDISRIYGDVYVTDKTIVSSGTYERCWQSEPDFGTCIVDEETGRPYHHILDPDTGLSVINNVEMVTIITDNSTDADALSTSVLALGLVDGMALVESLDHVEASFITYDKEVYLSSGMLEHYGLEISEEQFVVKSINDLE